MLGDPFVLPDICFQLLPHMNQLPSVSKTAEIKIVLMQSIAYLGNNYVDTDMILGLCPGGVQNTCVS